MFRIPSFCASSPEFLSRDSRFVGSFMLKTDNWVAYKRRKTVGETREGSSTVEIILNCSNS